MDEQQEKIKVLTIDDDPTLHLWAKRHLSQANFHPYSALNGIDGVNAFKKHVPDITLVDVEMPDIDGFETCRRLRALPESKNLPILMITGTEDPEKIALAFQSGATDFVIKPINWQVLVHRLQYMATSSGVLQQLKQSQERLSETQKIAKLGHWEWEIGANSFHWSEEVFNIFQKDSNVFTPDYTSFLNCIHPSDRVQVKESLIDAVKSQQNCSLEYAILISDNQTRYVHQQVEIVNDNQQQIIALTGSIQDISERKRQENEVRHLAYYDSITNLPNRTYCYELMNKILVLSKRYQRKFAVLFLDLDNFKHINDSFGHHAGDLLLKEIAARLNKGLRQSDVTSRYTPENRHADIARLGGDEFVVILNEVQDIRDVAIVAENVQEWVSEPLMLDTHQVYTHASIGIAVYPQDGEDVSTLLKNADSAMYDAKKHSKGSYQFFHDFMTVEAKKYLELEASLHDAISLEELRLYYQPVVDAETGKLNGAEALIRWQSEKFGFLTPDSFIPIAEESGMIIKIGEWVIREACRQHKIWEQQDMGYLTIAVNLSGLQISDPNFISKVEAILEEYDLDSQYLIFELTESVIMEDTENMINTLYAIKALGIKLSIDDFGTGYSSLSYLKRFPLDSLKIDRSFVIDLPTNMGDVAIVTAIVTLAKSLNLTIVAEGVETEEQYGFLRQRECTDIQGYFFSKPLSVTEFENYWQKEQSGEMS